MKPAKELFDRMCFVSATSMPNEAKTIHLERGEVIADLRRSGVPESVIYKHLAEGHGVVSAERIVDNNTGNLTWNVSVRSGLFGDKISTVKVDHQPTADEAKDENDQPIVREWANKVVAETIISSILGENLRESVFDPHPLPLFVLHLSENVGNKNAYQLYTELDRKLRQAHWTVMMNEQRRWVIRPLREVTFQKPTNEQLVALGVQSGQSLGVVGAVTGEKIEDSAPSVKNLSRLFGSKADKVHEAMKKAKTGEEKSGLMKKACDFLKAEGVGHVKCDNGGVTYLEMSDPYDTTLIYDHAERAFRVGSWGEYVESRSSRFAHVLDEAGELALDKTMCKSCMGLGVCDGGSCNQCGGIGRISVSESSSTTRIASEPGAGKRITKAAMFGHSTDTALKVAASQDKDLNETPVSESLSVSPAKNNAIANTGDTPDDKNQVGLNKKGNTKPSGAAKGGSETTGKPLSGSPSGKLGDSPSGDAPVVGKQTEDDSDGSAKTTGKSFAKDAEKSKDDDGGFKSLKRSPLDQVSTKLAEALVEGQDSKKKE